MATEPPADAGPHPSWLRLALQPSVVRRALGYAVVVGAILIVINHGDAILAGAVDTRRLLKMALTVIVPYMVSTASSVAAQRETAGNGERPTVPDAGRGRADR